MAYVVPAGKVTWEGSSSEDVVGYRVYYNMTGEDPVYTDPYVEFGSDEELSRGCKARMTVLPSPWGGRQTLGEVHENPGKTAQRQSP